jgi:hypothetical protein
LVKITALLALIFKTLIMKKINLTITGLLLLLVVKGQNLKEIKDKEMYSPKQSTISSSFSNINITSEFGDNSASALASFGVGSSSVFSFSFKQPFETKPKKVDFFNQNGMATGTSAEIAFQHVFWETKVDDALFQAMKDKYAADNNISKGSPAYVAITTGDLKEEDQIKFWSNPKNKIGVPVLIGFGYAVAKNDIDFVIDSFSIAPSTESRTNHNLRFTIGVLARNRSVISLSAVQELKFESGDPLTRVFSLGISGQSFSKEITVGNPVKKNLTRFQLDYRQSFYKDSEITFAIAPSIAYRTVQKSIVLDMPIYFLNFKGEDKKVKGVQGGLSIGYTNKLKEKTTFKDGFGLSIFVGVPFDLFGYFRTK